MSDLQKKTARLIAEAQSLLESARADLQRRRESHARGGTSREQRERLASKLGPDGEQIVEELIRSQLGVLASQPHAEVAPMSPSSASSLARKRRTLV